MLFCSVGLLQVSSNHIEKETLDVSEHEVEFSCEIQKAGKHLSNQGMLEETEDISPDTGLFTCPCGRPLSNLPA